MTEQDVKKIQDEIDYRRLVYRKQALEAVKEARAQGDLSENFEYHAAKKGKNQNESRIRYLERLLKNSKIVKDRSKLDEVGLDNKVTVYLPEDDEEEIYKLVTSIRGNSLKGYISTESPLGKALMGQKTGDCVTVRVSDSYSYDVVIKNIDKSTDEKDDTIRKF